MLLSNIKSHFTSLVEQTGAAEADHLRSLASIAALKSKIIVDNHDEMQPDDSERDPLIK